MWIVRPDPGKMTISKCGGVKGKVRGDFFPGSCAHGSFPLQGTTGLIAESRVAVLHCVSGQGGRTNFFAAAPAWARIRCASAFFAGAGGEREDFRLFARNPPRA